MYPYLHNDYSARRVRVMLGLERSMGEVLADIWNAISEGL
jgi:hypothetical protein